MNIFHLEGDAKSQVGDGHVLPVHEEDVEEGPVPLAEVRHGHVGRLVRVGKDLQDVAVPVAAVPVLEQMIHVVIRSVVRRERKISR